jgi:hypothetical protein
LEAIAKRENLSVGDLEIINSMTSFYRDAGKIAYNFKVRVEPAGAHHSVLLNNKGEVLDRKQLEADELAAREARYGKMTSELNEWLARAPEDASRTIILWLKRKEGSPPSPPLPAEGFLTGEAYDASVKQWQEYYKQNTAETLSPIVARLEKLGCQITYKDDYIPLIVVDALPQQLREIKQWVEVQSIEHVIEFEPDDYKSAVQKKKK